MVSQPAHCAYSAFAKIEHDHGFENIVDLGLFEGQIHLRVPRYSSAAFEVSNAVAIEDHTMKRQRLASLSIDRTLIRIHR